MRAVMMHLKPGCVEPENIYMLPGSSTQCIFADIRIVSTSCEKHRLH